MQILKRNYVTANIPSGNTDDNKKILKKLVAANLVSGDPITRKPPPTISFFG